MGYDVGAANVLYGGDGDDLLRVDAEGDAPLAFRGAGGDDGHGSSFAGFESFDVFGSTASDDIVTGDGVDMISAGSGADRLRGLAGDDLLFGVDGDDTLRGDEGQDALWGGQGADKLFGGAGADSFMFDSLGDGLDRIQDFESGLDTIQIGSWLVPGVPAGVLDPASLNIDAAVGTGAQFVLVDTGANDKLIFDANGTGSGGAVGVAILKGESGLTAEDILIF